MQVQIIYNKYNKINSHTKIRAFKEKQMSLNLDMLSYSEIKSEHQRRKIRSVLSILWIDFRTTPWGLNLVINVHLCTKHYYTCHLFKYLLLKCVTIISSRYEYTYYVILLKRLYFILYCD